MLDQEDTSQKHAQTHLKSPTYPDGLSQKLEEQILKSQKLTEIKLTILVHVLVRNATQRIELEPPPISEVQTEDIVID